MLVSLLYKGSTFVYVLKPRASCLSGFCSPHFSLLYYQSFLLPSLWVQCLSTGIILPPMPMSGDIFDVTCGAPGIQCTGVTDAAKRTTVHEILQVPPHHTPRVLPQYYLAQESVKADRSLAYKHLSSLPASLPSLLFLSLLHSETHNCILNTFFLDSSSPSSYSCLSLSFFFFSSANFFWEKNKSIVLSCFYLNHLRQSGLAGIILAKVTSDSV